MHKSLLKFGRVVLIYASGQTQTDILNHSTLQPSRERSNHRDVQLSVTASRGFVGVTSERLVK